MGARRTRTSHRQVAPAIHIRHCLPITLSTWRRRLAFALGSIPRDGDPPTLDAANDRLRAHSGHAFADELRAAGTNVREIVLPGTHAILNRPRSDGFARGIHALVTWLRKHD